MASPRVLDPEPLLLPIRADAPAGENLRADASPTSPYYRIKDARNTARALERTAQQSEDPSSTSSADWRPVLALAPQVLTERSKDLEIAAWMIEAAARVQGFAGLRDGFLLVRKLVEGFWDELYPRPDDEGIATRVAPLTGLNGDEAEGTLLVPIGMIPLLRDDGGAPLSGWHYRIGREVSAIQDPEARQRRIDAGAGTLERFQAAVAAAPPADIFTVLDDVGEALAEFDAMVAALDQRCGRDSPPSSSIRQAICEVEECLRFLTKDLVRPAELGGSPAAGTGAAPAGAPGGARGSLSELRTRQDALEAIRRVRDFFRQSEPHSPVSYLLDQSVRWAQTPLHELVSELIPDQAAREAFQVRTGVHAVTRPANES